MPGIGPAEVAAKTGTDTPSARSAYDSNEGAKQGYFGASRREKSALQTPLPCKDKPRSHAMLRDDVRGNTPKRATRFERATFSLEGGSPPQTSGESTQLTEAGIASAAPTTATDAHLEALLAAWPQLSEEMRAAVRAMVEAAV